MTIQLPTLFVGRILERSTKDVEYCGIVTKCLMITDMIAFRTPQAKKIVLKSVFHKGSFEKLFCVW